jgi:spore maturation protein CgeB
MIQAVKKALKRVPLISAVNARFKARQLLSRNQRLTSHYREEAAKGPILYSEESAREQLRGSVAARIRTRPSTRHPRVLWVGADQNQDESGWLPALRRRCDVSVCVDADGGYGLRSFSPKKFDRRLVRENSEALAAQINIRASEAPFDMVLGQMWANYVDPEVLERARSVGCVVANIAMDDRLPEHWATWRGVRLGSVGLCRAVDAVFTTDPEALLRYAVERCPAFFFPLASDPQVFQPQPEENRDIGVSFVGSRYGIRARIVDSLESAGVTVSAFGPGWPAGAVTAAKAAEIFGRSKIILGVGTVGHTTNCYTLKLRDFDAPMSGALYLTHRNPDLLPLFAEGKEIECYESIYECVNKVRYYLDHPVQRAVIAEGGLHRARRDHTWDRRVDDLLKTIGFEI